MEHLEAFQAIADANGGTRVAGSPGYDASVDYVVERLTAAGYDVSLQDFTFDAFEENSPSVFERVSPYPEVYTDEDFLTMSYSGNGDVTAPLEAVGGIVIPSVRRVRERLLSDRLRRPHRRLYSPHPARHLRVQGLLPERAGAALDEGDRPLGEVGEVVR